MITAAALSLSQIRKKTKLRPFCGNIAHIAHIKKNGWCSADLFSVRTLVFFYCYAPSGHQQTVAHFAMTKSQAPHCLYHLATGCNSGGNPNRVTLNNV